ncbi:MAG: peptidylprolyl isomerase [Planctomycetota bacterium]
MNRWLRFQFLEGRRLLASDVDLVAFARALGDSGIELYGAAWSPAVTTQRALFEDGSRELPFVEVTNPDRSAGQLAIDEAITAFPTWVRRSDDARLTGIRTLEELAEFANIEIPTGDRPSFASVGNVTVQKGSPLHVPVDAYDPNGGPLTVSVSIENPALLTARVLDGNRSLSINVGGYGEMLFELFEQRAPVATGRLVELAEDGFYEDVIFHRIIDGFVIQGGDPTGTGTSGSSLPDFDDDFHSELQHNRSGVLSWAKSSDDTNNSQFFISEVPTRFLDFNHSVAGQLVEGEAVRDAISGHAVNGFDRPTIDISMDSIDVVDDFENSLILFQAAGEATGSTRVTITLTDQDGHSSQETIVVDVVNDTHNSQPFLRPIEEPLGPAGQSISVQLESIDVEGDPVTYFATSSDSRVTVATSNSGVVTVTPKSPFEGAVDVQVSVRPGPGVVGNGASDSDNQVVRFHFGGSGPADPPEPPDPSGELVELRSVVTDLEGNNISTINVGQEFLVVLEAIDLRNGFRRDGVYAAYVDIGFDPDVVQPIANAPITHADEFDLATSGVVGPMKIDELGAATTSLTPSGLETSTIAIVQMTAIAAGTSRFLLSPADDPGTDVLLFGSDDVVLPVDIRYTSASIEVAAPWHRVSNPTDVNGDGSVAPSDALATINVLAMMQGSFALHEDNVGTLDPDYRYDTNADGWVTPRDILRIVNVLNQSSQLGLESESTQTTSDFLRPNDDADQRDESALADPALAPLSP